MSNNDENNPSPIQNDSNSDIPEVDVNTPMSDLETTNVETLEVETSNLLMSDQPTEATIETVPEEAIDSAPEEVTETANVDQEARVRELQEARLIVEREAHNLIQEISIKDESAQRFAVWVDNHRRTFLWKMLSKMNEQLDKVQEKQNEFESTVSAIELPEPGELVRYRKRFHKTILSDK